MEKAKDTTPVNILLADDDDRYIFEVAVRQLAITVTFKTVADGSMLMDYLETHLESLPDVLFLDLNMPGKNGKECLIKIKSSQKL